MLSLQGNMTQMEKGMNKQEMKDFKGSANNANAMVPGMFNNSPVRIKDSHFRFRDSIDKDDKPGVHYNSVAPPGHWKSQHRESISQITINPEPVKSKKVNKYRIEQLKKSKDAAAAMS